MAQQQQNANITAPGFYGVNTEDSPFKADPGFCLVADNAVVDRLGRLGCRSAFASYTQTIALPTPLAAPGVASAQWEILQIAGCPINGTIEVVCVAAYVQRDATDTPIQQDYYLCIDNDGTLDSLAIPTLTDDSKLADAHLIPFMDKLYIFSEGNQALVYDGTSVSYLFSGTVDVDYIAPVDDTGTLAAQIDGNVALAAYGRLWVSGVNGDKQTIYYSDLLLPTQWYDGRATPADSQNTGGIIDVSEYWPNGEDVIVGLAAHNNFLIVFGRTSILVWANPTGDPAGNPGISLADTVNNLGLVSRDALTSIGSDLLFVDDTGVRSLGRTIQEKSVPIGDLTYNIRGDFQALLNSEESKKNISLSFWPDEDLVVCLFAGSEQAYVLAARAPSPTGGSKITRWTGCAFRRMAYIEYGDEARIFLAGTPNVGLLEYEGFVEYTDQPYIFKYESNYFDFGNSVQQKYLKRIDYTIVANNFISEGTVKWGFGGTLKYSKNFDVLASVPALFGLAKFNVDSYGDGPFTIKRYRINTKGSGAFLQTAYTQEVKGNSLSIQEINLHTLVGRTY